MCGSGRHGMILIGSLRQGVHHSLTLGHLSDACSWLSSSLECVALTGLVGRARQAVDAVWVRMCLCSATVCWLHSLLLFSQLEPSSLESELY